MDYKDIVERVGWGEEFSFFYHGEKYWISQNDEGRYLTKVNGNETQKFRNSEELFQNGKIEGRTISQIWDEIKEYF